MTLDFCKFKRTVAQYRKNINNMKNKKSDIKDVLFKKAQKLKLTFKEVVRDYVEKLV